MTTPPEGFVPFTQDNVQASFQASFARCLQEMGFCDFEVRDGSCALRLPQSDQVTMLYDSICGQAIMAGIDTAASIAVATQPRGVKATIYQHTHFLRPAANDDLRIEAQVKRFGKATAYVECSVSFVGSGELVAHGVLEYAFSVCLDIGIG